MGIVVLPWVLIHLPLMLWTYHESGSFWGPVMANRFRTSIFPATMLRILDQMRVINQVGLLANLRFAVVELSPLMFVGIVFALWSGFRRNREAALIISLLLFQGTLILWQLPYDFRFLGGLLYVPLIAAVLTLASPTTNTSQPASLTPLGKRVIELRNWIALTAVVPWLAFQMYYAQPFAEVALGITTRNQFRERFVALTHDYEVLNQILPQDAVLYVANGRVSLFDAPRRVVLTPLDLRQRTSIYRLTLKDVPEKEAFDATSTLNCDDVVYLNSDAVVETYRIPGKPPKTGTVTVRSCRIEAAIPAVERGRPGTDPLRAGRGIPSGIDAARERVPERALCWMPMVFAREDGMFRKSQAFATPEQRPSMFVLGTEFAAFEETLQGWELRLAT